MMAKFKCNRCGYIYAPVEGDPGNDVPPGTPFEDLPVDWTCPVCAAPQQRFHRDEPACRT